MLPEWLPVVCIENVEGVGIDRDDVGTAASDHRWGESAGELGSPQRLCIVWKSSTRGTTATRIVAIGWPVCRLIFLFIHWLAICGPEHESILVSNRFHLCASPLRSQRIEAAEFRLRVAGAVMGRGVEQPIARQHTVEAATPHPVIDLPVTGIKVHKLDSCPRRNDEPVCRLGDVAAMMEPVGVDIRRKLFFHLAC